MPLQVKEEEYLRILRPVAEKRGDRLFDSTEHGNRIFGSTTWRKDLEENGALVTDTWANNEKLHDLDSEEHAIFRIENWDKSDGKYMANKDIISDAIILASKFISIEQPLFAFWVRLVCGTLKRDETNSFWEISEPDGTAEEWLETNRFLLAAEAKIRFFPTYRSCTTESKDAIATTSLISPPIKTDSPRFNLYTDFRDRRIFSSGEGSISSMEGSPPTKEKSRSDLKASTVPSVWKRTESSPQEDVLIESGLSKRDSSPQEEASLELGGALRQRESSPQEAASTTSTSTYPNYNNEHTRDIKRRYGMDRDYWIAIRFHPIMWTELNEGEPNKDKRHSQSFKRRFIFKFAVDILHELAHAIWKMRAHKLYSALYMMREPSFATERFGRNDELGFVFEQWALGFHPFTAVGETQRGEEANGFAYVSALPVFSHVADRLYEIVPMEYVEKWFKQATWNRMEKEGMEARPKPKPCARFQLKLEQRGEKKTVWVAELVGENPSGSSSKIETEEEKKKRMKAQKKERKKAQKKEKKKREQE